jgi:hypothetical protein
MERALTLFFLRRFQPSGRFFARPSENVLRLWDSDRRGYEVYIRVRWDLACLVPCWTFVRGERCVKGFRTLRRVNVLHRRLPWRHDIWSPGI